MTLEQHPEVLNFVASEIKLLGHALFRVAVLNSSPRRPPALHISYVTLITSDVCSIRTQVPCEVDITRYSSMIPVRSERIPFIVH